MTSYKVHQKRETAKRQLLVMKSFHLMPRIRLWHVMSCHGMSCHVMSCQSATPPIEMPAAGVSLPSTVSRFQHHVDPQLSSKTQPILAPNSVQLAHTMMQGQFVKECQD